MKLQFNHDITVVHNYFCTPSDIARRAYYCLQNCGEFEARRRYRVIRENYKSYLILYTTEGLGVLKYRGQTISLKRGDVFFIDCEDAQEYYTAEGCGLWRFKFIHLFASNTKEYFQIFSQEGSYLIHHSNPAALDELFGDLFRCVKLSPAMHEERIAQILLSVLTELVIARRFKDEKRYQNFMTQATQYIQKHYRQKLSLEEIAASCRMSPFHFSRQFKAATGFSPYEYLIKYRLDVAKQLLGTTDLTISQISDQVGFCSSSSFIAAFKKHAGVTPASYRKLNI